MLLWDIKEGRLLIFPLVDWAGAGGESESGKNCWVLFFQPCWSFADEESMDRIATNKLFTPCCWETKPTHTHIHRSSEVDIMREEATLEYSCILGTEYIIYDVHVRQEEWIIWEINMQGQSPNSGLSMANLNLICTHFESRIKDRIADLPLADGRQPYFDQRPPTRSKPPDQKHRRPNEAACDPKIGAWRPMASLAARIGVCYHNTSKKNAWLPLDQNTKPAI